MFKTNKRPSWERQSPDWRLNESAPFLPYPRKKKGEGWYSRGLLPHYHLDHLYQHVTFHLADSLPLREIKKIQWILRHQPPNLKSAMLRKRLDRFLDSGAGACFFKVPSLARMMENNLMFHDQERYELHHWVVMPNHVHVLFRCLNGWHLADIVATWKKHAAHQINKYLRSANQGIGAPNASTFLRSGQRPNASKSKVIWHREYWDRFIRSDEHYLKVVDYIFKNPTKAYLVSREAEYPWSSARFFFKDPCT